MSSICLVLSRPFGRCRSSMALSSRFIRRRLPSTNLKLNSALVSVFCLFGSYIVFLYFVRIATVGEMCVHLESAVGQRRSADRDRCARQSVERALRSGEREIRRRLRSRTAIARQQQRHRASSKPFCLAEKLVVVVVVVVVVCAVVDARGCDGRRAILRIARIDLVCARSAVVRLEPHRVETCRAGNKAARQTGTCQTRFFASFVDRCVQVLPRFCCLFAQLLGNEVKLVEDNIQHQIFARIARSNAAVSGVEVPFTIVCFCACSV
jgi:hypothetical protein